MCGSRKYPYSPHRRDLKFQGGGGISKTQEFKALYEAKLEFPEGWEGHRANPFRGAGGGGGVWIFSGTTQLISVNYLVNSLIMLMEGVRVGST